LTWLNTIVIPFYASPMFTPEQLSQYFAHISFTFNLPASHSLVYLSELQKYHLATVPFENLTLHYSKHHLLSLDPQDLFRKVVGRRMGGYCMEINAFFGIVLRSLGFTVFSTGGRVKPDKEYLGW
jgi:arylamine N-acetyltransferase